MVRGLDQATYKQNYVLFFFFPSSNFNELENAKQNIYIGENRRDRVFFLHTFQWLVMQHS